MTRLDVVEVRIIEHCHYRCIACGAFSNIAKKEEYGPENYRRDLTRLTELFEGVNTFRIYGGEPLIAENLYAYMQIAREVLPDAKIELVTNGSMLPRKGNEFFEALQKYAIKTVISYYGDNLEKVDQGIEELRKRNLDVEIIPIRHFYIMQNFAEGNDPVLNRKMCVVSIASYLHGGRLYPCPYPFSYKHYDKKYGTQYACLEDGIDIHRSDVNGEQILRDLNQPIEFCKNCSSVPHYVKWEQGKESPYDWFATGENPHLLKDYSWYDFLLEVDKLVYNVLYVDQATGNVTYKCVEEAGLTGDIKKLVWIDDEYARLVFQRTFPRTVEKNDITYEIIMDRTQDNASSTESYINKLKAQTENYLIIFFSWDAKRKLKLIRELTNAVKNS